MRRWSAQLGILSLLTSLIIVVGPTSAFGGQSCAGSGNGDVMGTPKLEQATGDFDGNGKLDEVKLYFDRMGTGDAYTKIILDNGYKAVFHHGQSLGTTSILRVRDVDQDGDDEVFILNSLGALANQADILFFVDCELQQPVDDDGKAVAPSLGGDGGGVEYNALDCFAPSQGGKGITTWHSQTGPPTFDTYTVTRTENKIKDNGETGPAALIEKHTDQLTIATDHPDVAWLQWFNCGKRPKCDGKTQNTSGIMEKAGSNDGFASALACGDFDGDGFDDLAIGVP